MQRLSSRRSVSRVPQLLLLIGLLGCVSAFVSPIKPINSIMMTRSGLCRRLMSSGGDEVEPVNLPDKETARKDEKPVKVEKIVKNDKAYFVEQWADGSISFREEPLKDARVDTEGQNASPPKPRGAARFAPSGYDEPPPPPPSTSSRKMVEPPTRVNRPPGLFEVERREERRQQSRMEEDRGMMQALTLWGNEKGMLFGSLALAVGSSFFLYAWKSGALEASSRYRREEAMEYMLKNDGLGVEYDARRMGGIKVRFEDTGRVVSLDDQV